jgi:replicative DNA helicase
MGEMKILTIPLEQTRIETTILKNLIHNDTYAKKVIPFLTPEYFTDHIEQLAFDSIHAFITKYGSLPSREALILEVDSDNKMNETDFGNLGTLIASLDIEASETNLDWLLETTEKWCQEKAIYNSIMESISIMDGEHGSLDRGAIPDLLTKALGVSFDPDIGHNLIEDASERLEYYHREEEHMPFDLDYFNRITAGGLIKKTLNCLIAGTGVGKTLVMTHMASAALLQGKNVLYLTLEMSEEKIAERMDANLLDIPIEEVSKIPNAVYESKMKILRNKTNGTLIVKEYATAQAGANHFRHFLNELKMKSGFVPDLVVIDYLNLCISSRIRSIGGSINSYTYIKSIAEELRGLAKEFNVPILTATQINRDGQSNSDPDITNTSESFGLPATVDLLLALVSTEELEQENRLLIKQLKNRYNDVTKYKRFLVGIDRSKMRLYDIEESEQTLHNETGKTTEDKPIADNTAYGERHSEEEAMQWVTKKAGRKDFSGMNFN